MSYPCTGCGGCCQRVDKISLKGLGEDHPLFFPYKWDEKGVCEKLTKENKCSVYESRPLVCNIDKLADQIGLDKDTFYRENILACNKIMEEDGKPMEFRISLKQI
jgi:Fe-S-cluster containining protein